MRDDCRTRVRCFATVPATVVRLSASEYGQYGAGIRVRSLFRSKPTAAGCRDWSPDASDPAVASGQRALRACIWSRLLKLVLRSPVRTIL